jgi:hypothetical protein
MKTLTNTAALSIVALTLTLLATSTASARNPYGNVSCNGGGYSIPQFPQIPPSYHVPPTCPPSVPNFPCPPACPPNCPPSYPPACPPNYGKPQCPPTFQFSPPTGQYTPPTGQYSPPGDWSKQYGKQRGPSVPQQCGNGFAGFGY